MWAFGGHEESKTMRRGTPWPFHLVPGASPRPRFKSSRDYTTTRHASALKSALFSATSRGELHLTDTPAALRGPSVCSLMYGERGV